MEARRTQLAVAVIMLAVVAMMIPNADLGSVPGAVLLAGLVVLTVGTMVSLAGAAREAWASARR